MTTRSWLAGALTATFLLAGCTASGEGLGEGSDDAATLQHVEGSDLDQITLSSTAYRRLGIKTGTMTHAPAHSSNGRVTLTVPSDALLFDAEGETWVYVLKSPRSFLRVPVLLDRVNGDTAYLTDGPSPGTVVATVGVPELFGAEEGVEGE